MPLLDHEAPRADWEVLTICSLCKKVLVGARWLEVEEALRLVPPPGGERWHRLSDSVCETCEALVSLQIRPGSSGERPQLSALD